MKSLKDPHRGNCEHLAPREEEAATGREPAADDEPVRVIRSFGLGGATVPLPAGSTSRRGPSG